MNTNRTPFPTLLSIGAVLALSACASFTGPVSYPVSWAPIDSGLIADGCPRLEGTYSIRGIGTFPPELGEPPSLSTIFKRLGAGTGSTSPSATKRVWPVPSDAISVSINQTPGILKVTFLTENGEKTSLNFRRYRFSWSEERYDDIFTCYNSNKKPRLRFLAEPSSHAGGIAPIYFEGGGTLVFLLRAEDDSLIVQWRSESIGISAFLIGSRTSVNSIWWRYPLIKDVQ